VFIEDVDRLKFDEMENCKKKLQKGSFIISILNLSIGNTVLLRGMRIEVMRMTKCLIEMLTTQERHKSHTCALSFLTDSVCVGSFDHRSEVPTPVGISQLLPIGGPRPP
jgi:hypothetical protein